MSMKNLQDFESEETPPHPRSEIRGLRSLGYNFHTAVADVIDNSIAAKAKNIWIDFSWKGSDTYFIITDDGIGMTKDELVEAMRIGTKDPLVERQGDDLGRFGLGLKTASFSQCINVAVASKKEGEKIDYRCWDIDYVSEKKKWVLLKYISDKALLHRLQGLNRGTSVIWQQLDQVAGNVDAADNDKMNSFLETIAVMEKHLEMVFHDYLEKRRISIWVNDRKLLAWDPFLKSNGKTKMFSSSKLRNGIEINAYVLPTYLDMSNKEFTLAGGMKGWNAQQGFYVCRNKRVLISGEWLGLFKQEEHYKLARIMINFPASTLLDNEWRIDVKKEMIQLPLDIKHMLKEVADETRKEAVAIYRQIGKKKVKTSKKVDVSVWRQYKRRERLYYKINNEHPVIRDLIDNSGEKMFVKSVIRLIEETVPVIAIAENKIKELPFEGKSMVDLVRLVISCYKSLKVSGISDAEAIEIISHIEPFNHYPELLVDLDKSE